MKGFSIDVPGTLLGQMQRGRGCAARVAFSQNEGASELMSCLEHDPRLDVQVEDRAEYYARLAMHLHVDTRRIGKLLADRGEAEWCRTGNLAAPVLKEMALRGDLQASEVLLAALDGPGWRWAASELAELEEQGHPLSAAALQSIVGRMNAESITWFDHNTGLPFRKWASRSSKLAVLLASIGSAEPFTKPDTSLSTEALLAIAEPRNSQEIIKVLTARKDALSVAVLIRAAESDNYRHRLVAYSVLGAQADFCHLDEVCAWMEEDQRCPAEGQERFDRGRERSVRLRYLRALPCENLLPSARRWMAKPGRNVAADDIMERCAQPEDRGLLESKLRAVAGTESIYQTCSMVTALGRAGDPRSVPFLEHTFEVAPYSATRWRVLGALAEILKRQGREVSKLFEEALWDCEPQARRYAAEYTRLHDVALRRRLEELSDDPFEEGDIREAANNRMKSHA